MKTDRHSYRNPLILNPGVDKIGTAGIDGRRHISETTFLRAHFVELLKTEVTK